MLDQMVRFRRKFSVVLQEILNVVPKGRFDHLIEELAAKSLRLRLWSTVGHGGCGPGILFVATAFALGILVRFLR